MGTRRGSGSDDDTDAAPGTPAEEDGEADDLETIDAALLGEDAGGESSDAVPGVEGDEDLGDASSKRRRERAWQRVFRSNRALWITAAVAVLALVGGLLLGRFVLSPADQASLAGPPDPGLITVPVEWGVLSNDVTIRGEVGYADAVEVAIDTAALGGPAVVTGGLPEPGALLEALSIALEVTGRPVIVLPGELPAYRTLTFGMTGPDVIQFKEAMHALDIDVGDPASDLFDAQAAAAVTALYERAGYPAPPPPEGSAESVAIAQEGVRSARQMLDQARLDLSSASNGATASQILAADQAVAAAERERDAQYRAQPSDPLAVAAAEDAVALLQLQRQELTAAPDTTALQAAVASAEQSVADAETALTRAQEQVLPYLPAGEVLYLTTLPRRVDSVNVARGQVLQGPAMTVSGATLTLSGSAAPVDAALLEVGQEATFEMLDGTAHTARITALTPGDATTDRWTVTLEPAELTAEQTQLLQGANVRVSIPVGATVGEVLFVPVAALTAGPGGESRLEIVEGDPREGEGAQTRLVVVETGLAAAGLVEVAAVDGVLEAGDLVVVGR